MAFPSRTSPGRVGTPARKPPPTRTPIPCWRGTPLHGPPAYGTIHRHPPFGKKKRLVSQLRDKAFENTLRYHSSCRVPLRNTAPHACQLQADGITPVTRPRLLASSFSRRLQGDFHRRACPPRTKRRLSLQTFDRLLFLFFAKYPVTRLSYHISAVCQPYFPGFSPKNV